jgi:hypothetical protein
MHPSPPNILRALRIPARANHAMVGGITKGFLILDDLLDNMQMFR